MQWRRTETAEALRAHPLPPRPTELRSPEAAVPERRAETRGPEPEVTALKPRCTFPPPLGANPEIKAEAGGQGPKGGLLGPKLHSFKASFLSSEAPCPVRQLPKPPRAQKSIFTSS